MIHFDEWTSKLMIRGMEACLGFVNGEVKKFWGFK